MWWFLLGLGLGALILFIAIAISLGMAAGRYDDDMNDPVMQKLASKYRDH